VQHAVTEAVTLEPHGTASGALLTTQLALTGARGGTDAKTVTHMSKVGIANLAQGAFIIVDLRPREEFSVRWPEYAADTKNIPADEVYGRYLELLDAQKSILLDCGSVPAIKCEHSAERLATGGLRDIRLVDEGTYMAPACTKVE